MLMLMLDKKNVNRWEQVLNFYGPFLSLGIYSTTPSLYKLKEFSAPELAWHVPHSNSAHL